jgi:hypothetical protein
MATVSTHSLQPEPPDLERELSELVRDTAPRLFAVVQEYVPETGEPDGWVAAWGLAYEDGRADGVGVDGPLRLSLVAPERAMRWFGRSQDVTARLMWLGPGPT